MTYPGSGLYVSYNYDYGSQLVGICENLSATSCASATTPLVGFTYDDYGRRTTLNRANGVATAYGYDSNLRLASITEGSSGASYYTTLSYTYTPADQLASRDSTNSAYTYAALANPNDSYTINGLNQIGAVSSTSLSYDARGNLSGDGGGTYAYNANNLLTSAVQSGVTSTLTYDAENRLASITKNGTTTKFLYDGKDLIAEYNGSGTLLRRYVHGPGTDDPLVWYEGTGTSTKYFLHSDERGSVTLVTDGTTGAQYALNKYDEYGIPAAGNAGRFQYTGQTWMAELGLHYYKTRFYNPVLGRFMQTDPIGYGDGMNWYAYVKGDPLNANDPNGTDTHIFIVDDLDEHFPGGEHAAMYVDPRGNRPGFMYDPGGSFRNTGEDRRRGASQDFFEQEKGENLRNEFIQHETRGNGALYEITVKTSAKDEAEIYNAVKEEEDPGGLWCAKFVSDAVRGVGHFPDKGAATPGGMHRLADEAKVKSGNHGNDTKWMSPQTMEEQRRKEESTENKNSKDRTR